MQTDPIADYLTRIRNASSAGHDEVRIPTSKIMVEVARILHAEGYIRGFQIVEEDSRKNLRIMLKYLDTNKNPLISGIDRISRPGRRVYVRKDAIPRVLGGLGIGILSTPKGVVTDSRARKLGVGGELICQVW